MIELTQKQREYLAVEVIGFEIDGDDYVLVDYINGPGTSFMRSELRDKIDTWMPDQNLNQSVMLLGKFESWDIEYRLHFDGKNHVSIIDKKVCVADEYLPLAICLAVLKASGYEA